jgi:hypothetical protein
MTVSNSPTTLLDSALAAQGTQQQVQVAVLKKAQEAITQEGQAMVQMLDQSGTQSAGTDRASLDVYA